MVGRCRDTALQEFSAVNTAGILCGSALRGWALRGYCGYSAVGHCRDTLRLGAPGKLGIFIPNNGESNEKEHGNEMETRAVYGFL